jgi:hypothetical protein
MQGVLFFPKKQPNLKTAINPYCAHALKHLYKQQSLAGRSAGRVQQKHTVKTHCTSDLGSMLCRQDCRYVSK